MYVKINFLVHIIITYLIFLITKCTTCNEPVCASIVSKCMLSQSCNCTLMDCSCCKDCFSCLGHLYSECCSCFKMCPQTYTNNRLGNKSYVEDLSEPVTTLFEALTKKPDSKHRWTSLTYPVDVNIRILFPSYREEIEYYMKISTVEYQPIKPDTITLNCTVAYLTNCTSWNICKISCQSMGAKSYRWFHDGCCECIRDTCINYGINESKCTNCPSNKIELDTEMYEDYDDYGKDFDDYLYDNPT